MDNRGFNHIAGLHGIPNFHCWHHQAVRDVDQGVRLFLPWHRAYLYTFEQFLIDAAEDEGLATDEIALPWWDWRSTTSRTEGIPKEFGDQNDQDGNPNPLFSFTINQPQSGVAEPTERWPMNPAGLPPENTVEALRAKGDFDDFNDDLESFHDTLHGWIGGYLRDNQDRPIDRNGNLVTRREDVVFGHMGAVAVSAFDPIFWSHHAMIDRIWRLWQIDNGVETGFTPSLQSRVLEPFGMTVADVLDVARLDYDYAGAENEVM